MPSLRWRLVIVMVLAYILVAVVTGIAGYDEQSASVHKEIDARARNDAVILAAGSVSSLNAGTLGTLSTFVGSLTRADGVTYAAVTGDDGRVFASTIRSEDNHFKRVPNVTAPTTLPWSNGRVEAVAPISLNTQFGFAEIVINSSSSEQALFNFLVVAVVTRGVGLVLFILLSLLIAQYLLGPLGALARSAEAIRHGDLRTRVRVRGGGGELATLGLAFNEMAQALEFRIKHLTFLARSGAELPATLREGRDIEPLLKGFCGQLGAVGVALIAADGSDEESIWCSATSDERWKATALPLGRRRGPAGVRTEAGLTAMVVPVIGGAVFVTARNVERPFSEEEQQVITNFANQVGVAADNARLFASQQEALQVKDQFLSIVSHEFRTPLTTIKGYAQMLQRKVLGEPEAQRYTQNIDAQVGRLTRLVDDLIDVTRFGRGQFELAKQPTDLRPLLDDVVTRFRVVSRDHDFRLDLDDGLFAGYWDRDRIEQVLNNLVGNAVKYSPDGGEVTIATAHKNGNIMVSVRDQGHGISEADQAHLFERFYRGSAERRQIKGLGLGLYVTRRIVEAHGGTIDVRSRPGSGSEFTFTLPLASEPVAKSAN